MAVRISLLQKVIKIKELYAANKLTDAWKVWCELYDEFDSIKENDSEKSYIEEHETMKLFTNEEVYDITDEGKRITGYYK